MASVGKRRFLQKILAWMDGCILTLEHFEHNQQLPDALYPARINLLKRLGEEIPTGRTYDLSLCRGSKGSFVEERNYHWFADQICPIQDYQILDLIHQEPPVHYLILLQSEVNH